MERQSSCQQGQIRRVVQVAAPVDCRAQQGGMKEDTVDSVNSLISISVNSEQMCIQLSLSGVQVMHLSSWLCRLVSACTQ